MDLAYAKYNLHKIIIKIIPIRNKISDSIDIYQKIKQRITINTPKLGLSCGVAPFIQRDRSKGGMIMYMNSSGSRYWNQEPALLSIDGMN